MKVKYLHAGSNIFKQGEILDCREIAPGTFKLSGKNGMTFIGESEFDSTVEIVNDKPGRPLNRNLELTRDAEIKRLNKVIEEKNRAISGFKQYDAQRKVYYERLEQNYKMMEERFNEFNRIVDECEDIDSHTKAYVERIVARMYERRVNDDIEGGALNGILTRLGKMTEHLNALTSLASVVNDSELRDSIAKEVRTLQTIRGNAVNYINKKLKKITEG